MTIETEIAALTTATTDLLSAVNVSKITLDTKVADATAQAGTATIQAAAAANSALTVTEVATVVDNMASIIDVSTNMASVTGATTQAATATNQAGVATTQASNAATSAGIATTQATTATTKAGEAAASAGASATSASAALTSEQNADVSEASALAAKVAAESARDAALIQAGVYVDEPTGRAAVADGVAFKVQGSGDIAAYEYRRTNSTTSVLIATYPSSDYIQPLLDKSYSSRTGFAEAWMDQNNSMALGITTEGRVVFGIGGDIDANIAAISHTQSNLTFNRSGYLWAFEDSEGNVAGGISESGDLISKGINLTTQFDVSTAAIAANTAAIAAIAAPSKWITPSGFAQFGDSMTPGVIAPLSALLGLTVQNGGVGGQVSSQIAARFGGIVSYATAAGNSIPATGSVAVTLTQSLHNNQGPGNISCSIASIPGILSATFDGGGALIGTTFTRNTSGSAVYCGTETPVIVDTTDLRDFKTVILWLGRNNYGSPETVKADVKACVDFLKCQDKRFVVMSVCNGQYSGEYIGQTAYNTLIALNNDLKKMYPNNYIDIRKVIVNSYDPGIPQDVIDYNNDTTPTSLRQDSIHLNTAGNSIVAQTIYNFLTTKGWAA